MSKGFKRLTETTKVVKIFTNYGGCTMREDHPSNVSNNLQGTAVAKVQINTNIWILQGSADHDS